jgi:hypothetical protein
MALAMKKKNANRVCQATKGRRSDGSVGGTDVVIDSSMLDLVVFNVAIC